MRAADLLGRPVVTQAGERLGKVLDIRVVQDGPLLGTMAALRVDGLVVGRSALASRLGYDRAGVGGPLILRAIAHRLMAGNRYLPWDQVVEVAGDRVVTAGTELAPVPMLPGAR